MHRIATAKHTKETQQMENIVNIITYTTCVCCGLCSVCVTTAFPKRQPNNDNNSNSNNNIKKRQWSRQSHLQSTAPRPPFVSPRTSQPRNRWAAAHLVNKRISVIFSQRKIYGVTLALTSYYWQLEVAIVVGTETWARPGGVLLPNAIFIWLWH